MLTIVHYPHPALRHQSKPLTAIDNEVRRMAEMMLERMYESKGLGLAANQVNWPFQLLVMNPTADPKQRDKEHVCINPIIVDRSGSMEGEEGCLSFPDLYQKVRRAKTIKARYYDLEGRLIEVECSDMPSRILQHEIDHLQGVLFIDRMNDIGKMAARGPIRVFEDDYQRAQRKGQIPPDDEIQRQLREMEEKRNNPPPPAA